MTVAIHPDEALVLVRAIDVAADVLLEEYDRRTPQADAKGALEREDAAWLGLAEAVRARLMPLAAGKA